MGFRDDRKISYWGRIPKKLAENGYKIALSSQDSNASIQSNAAQIAKRLDEILQANNAEKVNIIAHSKGGLEARYLASTLGFDKKIASITTISTPHNGSKTVDALMKFPAFAVKFGCKIADLWFKILKDKEPDTYSAICSFRTADAQKFNSQNPDCDGIYYQSYGFKMKNCFSDPFLFLPNIVVNHFDGENDGLLSPSSAEWTNFREVVTGSTNRGVSHCDEVDMRRKKLSLNTANGIADIPDLYVAIAKELENKGF